MGRMSVATVSSPEFINITSISPFAKQCEIKVFYLGKNRNGSFIDRAVAEQMAQTLPGCPIVGYYSEDKEDFRDHGEQVVIDGDGIKFKCQTVPYGFVAPDAKVWFKDFEDTDEFGNTVVRTYLMTTGYLWTKQYEEAQKVINEGRPQSMELDPETMKGYWSTDSNSGLDFFIINDAIFTKLCILGEDVEPCFEGSSVTAPDVSSNFSKDDNFTKTLYTMMKELKELTFSLQDKGGNSMLDNENIEVQNEEVQQDQFALAASETNVAEPAVEPAVEAPVETPAVEEPVVEQPVKEEPVVEEKPAKKGKNSKSQDKVDLEASSEIQNTTEEFVKKDDDEENSDSESNSDDETENEDDEEKKKASKNTLEEKYALLESELKELQDKYASLESENKELKEFKLNVEDKQKEELINSFYMLSDEDKKEVIENRSKYTLDDIEKTLSVICVRKKVNFSLDDETNEGNGETAPVTFNLGVGEESLPAWLKAVEAHKNAE